MGKEFSRAYMRHLEKEYPGRRNLIRSYMMTNDKTCQQLIALTFVLVLVVSIWMWYYEEGFIRVFFFIIMAGTFFMIGFMTQHRINEMENNLI